MAFVPTRANLPVKFHPPKSFRFPKRKLRMKAERSFRAEWCEDDHIHASEYTIYASTTTLVAIQPSVTSI